MVTAPKDYVVRSHLVDMHVTFNKALPSKINALVGPFSPLQKYIDHEVIRTIQPYVPLLTGTLIRSATIFTLIGSGEIKWRTPYARRMYFENPGPEVPRTTGPLRGKLWAERWKKDGWVEKIMRGASAKFGIKVS
jgi:hypothetical protein